jgi:L-2-hydroxyglutarate oxidase LhgO
VVCQDRQDVARLEELYRRGIANGVNIEILDSKDLGKIEPAAQTVDKFIWSPTTAVGNPKEVIIKLAEKFTKSGGNFSFNTQVELIEKDNEILIKTKDVAYSAKSLINAAGAYAADLAKQVNVGT